MKHKDTVPLMGRVVVVEKTLVRKKEGDERFWVTKECSKRAGWVVGFRTLQNGRICRETYEGPEEVWLHPSKSIKCILVSFWPTMEAVRVPLDGFRIDPIARPQAPSYPWTEQDRDSLRKEMQNAPRDAKGRWAPIR